MLLSEIVEVRWNPSNKKYYEDRNYIYTKMNDKFKIKIEDLPTNSNIHVKVKCDCEDCLNPILNPKWQDYNRSIHEDGKYYCKKCTHVLFAGEKMRLTKLKNGKSFEQWCIENDRKNILDLWDYKLNKCKPSEIGYATHRKYWFKCSKNIHDSELKDIAVITERGNIKCDQCNTFWEVYPEYTKYFIYIDDAKKYSAMSSKEIKLKCPECGFVKKMPISRLITQGFACPKCGDGISYPEKFMFNVLEQILSNNFIYQFSPKWANTKKYDFYIPSINCIIEIHGLQHYEKTFDTCGGRSLQQEQENDKLKEQLAKENGIENYIVIDCRYSDLEFIKKNILNSELNNLFELTKVDWLRCEEHACNSLVKIVCDMWNKDINNAQKIADKLKMSKSTICNYLKQGTLLKWCNYDGKEQFLLNIEQKSIPIICLNTKEKFDSIKEAQRKYHVNNISNYLKGIITSAGKDKNTGEYLIWMYYEDYLKLTDQEIESKLNIKRKRSIQSKEVVCLNNLKIYESLQDASNDTKCNISCISACCRYKQKNTRGFRFMFYDEYIKLQELA